MSLLWSNISVLQPAICARMPQPNVTRRFKDNDPVARVASEMVERAIQYTFDDADFDGVMRGVRDDYLLTARGTAWVRYDAEFSPLTADDGNPPSPLSTLRWTDSAIRLRSTWRRRTRRRTCLRVTRR
jgi:hypothetical protein